MLNKVRKLQGSARLQSFMPCKKGAFSATHLTKPTLTVAKALLGQRLVTTVGGQTTAGMIVEVEAYGGSCEQGIRDRACHAFRGRTQRNEVMFWAGGHCYVYFIYGMHHCVNVVTEGEDTGSAVLIRALEPIDGIATMRERRGNVALESLTNGPGKLCQALGIDRTLCGEFLPTSKLIRIEPHQRISRSKIGASKRIGISQSKSLPWRFFLRGNPYVSRTS